MPSFLSPAFLAGLLAVVIPILVHLRMRERKTSMPFPSLMFVRRIPHKSFRRRTLQNLLLFAARALALVLLCLAFARPYFPVNAASGARVLGPLARVVALDISASMQYEGVFPRALAEAERAIREVRAEDAVGVLLFSDEVLGLVPPSTDHAKALAALKEVTPGPRSTRFAPALRLASDWLSALKVDRREVVLITDGQTRALLGATEVSLPAGTAVMARSVAPPDPDNATVADVTVENVPDGDRTFAVVTARLIHQGKSSREITVTLEVAGRKVEEKTVSLPASGSANVTFDRAPLPNGPSKGRLSLTADGLHVDDSFHFVLGAGGDVGVLLVDESPYVARALEIGHQPSFNIARRSAPAPSDLKDRSLVVAGSGALNWTAAFSTALAQFVREGGGLLLTTPLASLRGEAARLLPLSWGESVSRLGDRGASLGFVDLDHPALFAFKQARGSDFSRARFLQYRVLKEDRDPDTSPIKVLARFDDGREALIEAAFGSGRVLAFTSPLDGLMSDLPVQPLFLPLIHELARYASAHKDTPLYHRIGAAVDLGEGRRGAPQNRVKVVRPSGRREDIPGGTAGIELLEAGFYETAREASHQGLVAVNIDTGESDLSSMDRDELEAALQQGSRTSELINPVTPLEEGARQSWWRLALLAVALLMIAETILGNARGQKAAS